MASLKIHFLNEKMMVCMKQLQARVSIICELPSVDWARRLERALPYMPAEEGQTNTAFSGRPVFSPSLLLPL